VARWVRNAMGMAAKKAMKDDPNEIVVHLIKEHGLEGAKYVVAEGIAEAHRKRGLYELSIWRDVRKILDDR